MPHPDLNLPALRKIAEGATQGEWRLAEWGAVIVTNNAKIGGDVRLFDVRGWGYLTGKGHGGLGMEPEDAIAQQMADGRHVATFDPPTTLRLLDRLAKAEADRDEFRSCFMQSCQPVPVSPALEHIVESVCEWVNKRGGDETAEQITAMAAAAVMRVHGDFVARAEAAEASLAQAVEMARREEREAFDWGDFVEWADDFLTQVAMSLPFVTGFDNTEALNRAARAIDVAETLADKVERAKEALAARATPERTA